MYRYAYTKQIPWAGWESMLDSGPDMTLSLICGTQEKPADWKGIAVGLHCCKLSRIGHCIWLHTISVSFSPGIYTFPITES